MRLPNPSVLCGYPFKTNGGPEPGVGSGQVFFYHNTAWAADPKSSAMLVKKAKWAKLAFRNNIWRGHANRLESWRSPLSPMDFDYDNLYVCNTNAPLALSATTTPVTTRCGMCRASWAT